MIKVASSSFYEKYPLYVYIDYYTACYFIIFSNEVVIYSDVRGPSKA